MEAHAADLRGEVQDRADGAELVEAIKRDYRAGPLSAADRAMLDYAVKLTRTPAAMTAADLATLRAAGFGEHALYDIIQITALFAYYNRLADGAGIEDEPEWDSQA